MNPLENPLEDISLAVVRQKYMPTVSRETIERMCRKKVFKTAFKAGGTKHSHWRVKRGEVMSHAHRFNTEFLSQSAVQQ